MKVYIGNTIIECTPGEYIELQQKGVFSQAEPKQGTSTKQEYKQDYNDGLKKGMTDVVAVYGVQFSQTTNTTLPINKENIGTNSVLNIPQK